MERILCAAIWFIDEKQHEHQPKNIQSGIVVCGRRHHNVFATLTALNIDRLNIGRAVQGFMTSENRFVGREEAAVIAYQSGQISKQVDSLISEELY